MKEGVLDILIYLFENYFDGELDEGDEPDRDTLKQELEHAGFPAGEVERALCWLEDLASDPTRNSGTPHRPRRDPGVRRARSRPGSTPIAAASSCTSRTSASSRPSSGSW